jgi:hypothetical protein
MLKYASAPPSVQPRSLLQHRRHQRNQSHFVVGEEDDGRQPVLHWTMEICFVHDTTDNNPDDTTGSHSKMTNTTTATTTTKLDISYASHDTIVVHSIPETISLPELLEKAITKRESTKRRRHSTLSSSSSSSLQNTASSILSSSTDDDTYQWYLKQIPCPANHPTYIHVATTTTNQHTTTTLTDILRHQTILEFPTLYLMRTTTTTLEK